ncbi:MAG: RNA polymerase sigma factor [Saprospiraceae bacterium]
MSLEHFQKHILPYKDKLYRFAYSLLNNAPEAEDVVQEVLVKIWQRRDTWHEVDNMQALTMKMTKNLALDKMRSKYARTGSLPEHFDWRSDEATPEEQTTQEDQIARIRQLMQCLPDKHRQVMQLRDIEGLTYDEIGEVLDMPMNQVKINLFRARQYIKEHLLKTESYGL